ncbi:MAG: hypothetical protein ACYDAY_09415 [Candidatus Dormibacteria bacterium]
MTESELRRDLRAALGPPDAPPGLATRVHLALAAPDARLGWARGLAVAGGVALVVVALAGGGLALRNLHPNLTAGLLATSPTPAACPTQPASEGNAPCVVAIAPSPIPSGSGQCCAPSPGGTSVPVATRPPATPAPASSPPPASPVPSTAAGVMTIDESDHFKTFHVAPGTVIDIVLPGDGQQYHGYSTPSSSDVRVLTPNGVTCSAAAQPGYFCTAFKAIANGDVQVTATNDPPCLQATPPCGAPSKLFRVEVVVGS